MKDLIKNLALVFLTPILMLLGWWWAAKTVTWAFTIFGFLAYLLILFVLRNPSRIDKDKISYTKPDYPTLPMLWFSRAVAAGCLTVYYMRGDLVTFTVGAFGFIMGFFIMGAIDELHKLYGK